MKNNKFIGKHDNLEFFLEFEKPVSEKLVHGLFSLLSWVFEVPITKNLKKLTIKAIK